MMRLPNLYLWFPNREKRMEYLYMVMGIPLMDFKSKRKMQPLIERMEIGATSSPFYRIFKHISDNPPKDSNPISPDSLYRHGLRRIYFRRSVAGRYGDWMVLQFRSTHKARKLYVSILADFPKQDLYTNVPLSAKIQAEVRLKNARYLIDKMSSNDRVTLQAINDELVSAYQLDPTVFHDEHIYMWEQLAQAWFEAKKYDNMEQCLIHKASLQPGSADAFLNLGFYYGQIQQKEKAKDAYVRGLKANPHDEFLLHNLANLYSSLGNKKKALKAVNEAILENPSLPPIYELKGHIHLSWEEPELALRCYKHALTLITEEWENLRRSLLKRISVLQAQLVLHRTF